MGLLVGWWWALAPAAVGGRAALVVVSGHSMEPLLHSGDVVIVRAQPAYTIGDVAVVDFGRGMHVIHRIIDGSAASGWRTQGINNPAADQWLVPDEAIQGTLWVVVPRLGDALMWLHDNPFASGGIVAGICLLAFLPIRMGPLHPDLKAALCHAQRESRRGVRPASDYMVLVVTAVGTLAAGWVVGQALLKGSWTLLASLSLLGLVGTGASLLWVIERMYDGRGKLEPARSTYALSGRLRRVETLPARDDDPQRVKSPVALRKKAERYGLPILHRVDPVAGHHSYLLITRQEGDFLWEPTVPRRAPEGQDDEPGLMWRSPKSPMSPSELPLSVTQRD